MLSFSKGRVVGEGADQDELADFEGCFPQQVSGLRQRAQMVRMADCSFAQERVIACAQQCFLLHVWPRWVRLTSPIEGPGHSKEELGFRGFGGQVFSSGG